MRNDSTPGHLQTYDVLTSIGVHRFKQTLDYYINNAGYPRYANYEMYNSSIGHIIFLFLSTGNFWEANGTNYGKKNKDTGESLL